MIVAAVALPDPRRIGAHGHWEDSAYDASLGAIRAAGYDGFELSRTRRLTAAAAAAVRDRAAALGLTAVALHAPSLHGPGALERQLAAVGVARALGVALIVFHVSSLRFAAADAAVRRRARATDGARVRAVAEAAGEYGVQLLLENASHPEHPAYLLELRAALSLPNLGVALDTGHANLRGTRAHEVAAGLAPAVRHTHINDNRGARDEHLVPGQGSIDWVRVAAALDEAGYGGAWCVELKSLPPGPQEGALREARRFLATLL